MYVFYDFFIYSLQIWKIYNSIVHEFNKIFKINMCFWDGKPFFSIFVLPFYKFKKSSITPISQSVWPFLIMIQVSAQFWRKLSYRNIFYLLVIEHQKYTKYTVCCISVYCQRHRTVTCKTLAQNGLIRFSCTRKVCVMAAHLHGTRNTAFRVRCC